MAALVRPAVRWHGSFLDAMDEQEDWLDAFDTTRSDITEGAGFARYLGRLASHEQPGAELPAHFVPSTTLWWVDGPTFCGRVSIRHRLNDRLRSLGGHIGYWMRPSVRGRGHATAAFAAALAFAHGLGIECALVTCDPDNTASRRIIEGAGGLFETVRGPKRLYWVPTSTPSPAAS